MNGRIDHGNFTSATGPVERQLRRPVQLPALAVLAEGQTVELTVRDLSYDGCCVGTPIELVPGQLIKLSVLRRGEIEAEVRWCQNGLAGLAFGLQSERGAELQPRNTDRIEAHAEVTLRKQGHRKYRVRLFDVSREGCKTEFVERPSPGSHVWIKFDGLEALDAEVCWVEGFQAGLKYTNPIHPAVFDMLTQRLRMTP